jgi:hypothetical protein
MLIIGTKVTPMELAKGELERIVYVTVGDGRGV